MANGADNLFMQQRNIPEHQQKVTNEFNDTANRVDGRFKPKYQQHTRPSMSIEHRSTDTPSLEKEPMTVIELGDSPRRRRMSMEPT